MSKSAFFAEIVVFFLRNGVFFIVFFFFLLQPAWADWVLPVEYVRLSYYITKD